MKYLTKEWYELCQQTGLHFGMRVHNGAEGYDEALYLRLYKRKEKEFVKMQREAYVLCWNKMDAHSYLLINLQMEK